MFWAGVSHGIDPVRTRGHDSLAGGTIMTSITAHLSTAELEARKLKHDALASAGADRLGKIDKEADVCRDHFWAEGEKMDQTPR
jgi:hypothetical protein